MIKGSNKERADRVGTGQRGQCPDLVSTLSGFRLIAGVLILRTGGRAETKASSRASGMTNGSRCQKRNSLSGAQARWAPYPRTTYRCHESLLRSFSLLLSPPLSQTPVSDVTASPLFLTAPQSLSFLPAEESPMSIAINPARCARLSSPESRKKVKGYYLWKIHLFAYEDPFIRKESERTILALCLC